MLASPDLDVDAKYFAVSGNADFIVAGGHAQAGTLRFSSDSSAGPVLTKIGVASQHTEWMRSYGCDGHEAIKALAVSPSSQPDPSIVMVINSFDQPASGSDYKSIFVMVRASDGGVKYPAFKTASTGKPYSVNSSRMLFLGPSDELYFGMSVLQEIDGRNPDKYQMNINKYDFANENDLLRKAIYLDDPDRVPGARDGSATWSISHSEDFSKIYIGGTTNTGGINTLGGSKFAPSLMITD